VKRRDNPQISQINSDFLRGYNKTGCHSREGGCRFNIFTLTDAQLLSEIPGLFQKNVAIYEVFVCKIRLNRQPRRRESSAGDFRKAK
jgi:hypothetical protein